MHFLVGLSNKVIVDLLLFLTLGERYIIPLGTT